MHHVEVKRRMGEADIAALVRLVEAATAADGHRALGEHKWLDLVQGGREGFAGFIARDTSRGRVIGYAQISRGESRSWAVEYVVHPDWRGLEPDLRLELVRAALDEIAVQGGGHVHLWVPKPTAADDQVAADAGLQRGRDLYQMRCKLPLDQPLSTIETRPFKPSHDEEGWLAVNNAAFRGHPEQGSWTLETIVDREQQSWFDPDGFLLHEVDGALAGFCWTKIQPDDEEDEMLGEIYVIAVNPDYQGRGLGKQLVLAGLEYLAGKDLTTGMLYVDRDNVEARSLYKGIGFFDDHVDRAYTGDVAPAHGTA
ncbi:MAG TPA: mycothiol synthase [Acidimicrobiales bacterium]|nr:mycothiol synthase [Acidimicrobiales bacterium]